MNRPLRARLQSGILIVAVLLIVGYTLLQTRDLIWGTPLVIYEPQDGETLREETVLVRGYVRNASRITLNGSPILTDREGLFREVVILAKGLNVLELRAVDKFNRERIRRLSLVVVPDPNSPHQDAQESEATRERTE